MPQIRPATCGRKSYLPVDEILHLLDEGHTQTYVAILYGVTQPTISRLFSSTQKGPAIKKIDPSVKLCSCCNKRPVAKGNHTLCSWCFAHEDTAGSSFADHALAI
ncbi:helix-turn-helix domain-containing protein [Desulfoluna spongiiphila]|uniref:hypothetical protein n=1 Tax=Desulfoluna spongiiphila TaxID=419481 RepID=UPI00125B88E7|nr:hypothetical protein [Desulfoluna spongiiphila]VVS90757.1 hypothetical protein DBB_3240 [Desulfoluna spongiiphila]